MKLYKIETDLQENMNQINTKITALSGKSIQILILSFSCVKSVIKYLKRDMFNAYNIQFLVGKISDVNERVTKLSEKGTDTVVNRLSGYLLF